MYLTAGDSDEDQKIRFQRDDTLLKKLDRIILYLRIVHSVDFYNHGEYPNEDVMPNRSVLLVLVVLEDGHYFSVVDMFLFCALSFLVSP